VTEAGFDLEDVDVSPQRGNRTGSLRVLVDKDGGIDLDDVADVARSISAALDADSTTDRILGDATYVLEVSSPGVDRPLREPRHWRRNVGRLVTVAVSGVDQTGRVLTADDDAGGGIQLEVAGLKGRPAKMISARYADLGPGRVQVEFNRTSALDDLDDQSGDDLDTADVDDDDQDDELDDELDDDPDDPDDPDNSAELTAEEAR
jgi:ribosome maturation factor RimP